MTNDRGLETSPFVWGPVLELERKSATRVAELYHSFEGSMREGVVMAIGEIARHDPDRGEKIILDVFSKPIHCSGWGNGKDQKLNSHPIYDERDLVAILDDLPEDTLSKVADVVIGDISTDTPSDINRKHAVFAAIVRSVKLRSIRGDVFTKYEGEIKALFPDDKELPYSELDDLSQMVSSPRVDGVKAVEELRRIESDEEFFAELTKIVRLALPKQVLVVPLRNDPSGTNRWFFEVPLLACLGRWITNIGSFRKFTAEMKSTFVKRTFKTIDNAVIVGSDSSATDNGRFYGMLESGGLKGLGYIEAMSAYFEDKV